MRFFFIYKLLDFPSSFSLCEIFIVYYIIIIFISLIHLKSLYKMIFILFFHIIFIYMVCHLNGGKMEFIFIFFHEKKKTFNFLHLYSQFSSFLRSGSESDYQADSSTLLEEKKTKRTRNSVDKRFIDYFALFSAHNSCE